LVAAPDILTESCTRTESGNVRGGHQSSISVRPP